MRNIVPSPATNQRQVVTSTTSVKDRISQFQACQAFGAAEMPLTTLAQVAATLQRRQRDVHVEEDVVGKEDLNRNPRELPEKIRQDSNCNDLTLKPDECHLRELVDVKIVGIHKQQIPKTSFYFILLVMRKDGSNITVYRKWKEMRTLQNSLQKEIDGDQFLAEPRYFLKKLKNKTFVQSITPYLGTMKRLKVIDAMNVYFQALVYYKKLHSYPVVEDFFAPTDTDLSSSKWCGNGKTYFYVTSSMTTKNVEIEESGKSDESDWNSTCSSETIDSEDGNSIAGRISSTAMSLYSTHLSEPDLSSVSPRDSVVISAPTQSEIHVALEDHVSDDDQSQQSIMSLWKGEKVEVLAKSDSGWWFVRRVTGHVDDDETGETGYVPAAFLRREHGTLSHAFSQPMLNVASPVPARRKRSLDTSSSLESRTSSQSSSSSGSTLSRCNTINYSLSSEESSRAVEFISKQGYVARNRDELSFGENAILRVMRKNDDGWWLARYKHREGLVPAVFLKKYHDPIRRLSLEVLKMND